MRYDEIAVNAVQERRDEWARQCVFGSAILVSARFAEIGYKPTDAEIALACVLFSARFNMFDGVALNACEHVKKMHYSDDESRSALCDCVNTWFEKGCPKHGF